MPPKRLLLPVLVMIALASVPAGQAFADSALGPRMGLSGGDDDFFLGVQTEFGPILEAATLVNSLDFTLGDHSSTALNTELRFYLVPLPETGIMFYCAGGPTLLLSPDTELGLSLVLGLHIPMKDTRRYNIEYRWGVVDIPDHKIGLTVMFGL
ncbi:MAG: hypothetical protein ABFS42_16785 [Candidatus Krumholzibacteriota bacterium]